MNEENKLVIPRVVKVVDRYTLVLNVGEFNGIDKGDNFLVYYVDPEELIDPETNESLGNLEVVRGSGSVTHVQEKMCTIKSNRTESGGRIIRKATSGILGAIHGDVVEEPSQTALPFEGADIGDYAKQV